MNLGHLVLVACLGTLAAMLILLAEGPLIAVASAYVGVANLGLLASAWTRGMRYEAPQDCAASPWRAGLDPR